MAQKWIAVAFLGTRLSMQVLLGGGEDLFSFQLWWMNHVAPNGFSQVLFACCTTRPHIQLVWTRCIMHPSSSSPPDSSLPMPLPPLRLVASSTCPGRPALPCLSPQTDTGNEQWLEESSRHCPHRQTPPLLLLYIRYPKLSGGSCLELRNLPSRLDVGSRLPVVV